MQYVPADTDQAIVVDFSRELGSFIKNTSGFAEYAFLPDYLKGVVFFQHSSWGQTSNIVIAQLVPGVDGQSFFEQLFWQFSWESNTIKDLWNGIVAYWLPQNLRYLNDIYTSLEQGNMKSLLEKNEKGYQIGFVSKTRPELAGEVNPLAAAVISSVTHTLAFGYVDRDGIRGTVRILSDRPLPSPEDYQYNSVLTSYAAQSFAYVELGNLIKLFGIQPQMMQQSLKFWLQGFKNPAVYQLTETDISNIVKSFDGNIALVLSPASNPLNAWLSIVFQHTGIVSTLPRLFPVLSVVFTGIGDVNFGLNTQWIYFSLPLDWQNIQIPVVGSGDGNNDIVSLWDPDLSRQKWISLSVSSQSYLGLRIDGEKVLDFLTSWSVTNPTPFLDFSYLKGRTIEGSLRPEDNQLVFDIVLK